MSDDIPVRRLCVLPHHGPTPAVPEPALLCIGHTHAMRTMLADITRLWDTLDELADSVTGAGRRSGENTAAPCRLDIIAIRDPHTRPDPDGLLPPAAGILLDWAALIADARHLTPATSVDAGLTLLRVHLDWLLDRPEITDAHRELRLVLTALRRVCGENRIVIGRCQEPHPDPQVDDECGGPLFHHPDSTDPVQCASCGSAWSAGAIALAVEQMDLATWLNQQQHGA